MNPRLPDFWKKTLGRFGPKPAVIEAAGETVASFQELDRLSLVWLDAHQADSLRGATVVFATPNGIGWLTLFLALAKAGAVIVPLDAAEPVASQRSLAEALGANFWWNGQRLIALESTRKNRRDDDTCLIKLTSGTTGTARALRFNAQQLLADGRQVTSSMGITSRDLNYALIPLGHSYGLGNLTLPLLVQGIPLVCGASPLPHAIAADFTRWRPTVFPGVPAMWRALLESGARLESLRLGISAGAPLPAATARDFFQRFGQRLHNFYGSSETGGIAFDRTGKATLEGGVGRAMRGVTLTLIGTSRLEVSSAAVFTRGNRRRRKKNGAWVMADAIRRDKQGNVTVLGRRGRTVKIAGRRVNLEEVTARLRRIAGVRDAWVAVDGGNDAVLGAVVVTDLTVPDLRTALHTDTAPWKIPKKWRIVPSLPLTSRGKPDAAAMRSSLF